MFHKIKFVIKDKRIPKWIKILAAFGLAPIPGPIDEIVLLFVLPILFIFYRPILKEAWNDRG